MSAVEPRSKIQAFEEGILQDLKRSYKSLDDGSWVHVLFRVPKKFLSLSEMNTVCMSFFRLFWPPLNREY
jgi:hypothetical protein